MENDHGQVWDYWITTVSIQTMHLNILLYFYNCNVLPSMMPYSAGLQQMNWSKLSMTQSHITMLLLHYVILPKAIIDFNFHHSVFRLTQCCWLRCCSLWQPDLSRWAEAQVHELCNSVFSELPNVADYDAVLSDSQTRADELKHKFMSFLRNIQQIENVEFVSVFGHRAGEALVAQAQQEGVSLIVTGSRGLGTMRRTVLGSVSDYILHHAACPVLVCTYKT